VISDAGVGLSIDTKLNEKGVAFGLSRFLASSRLVVQLVRILNRPPRVKGFRPLARALAIARSSALRLMSTILQ
jgi:hypothetical protein